MMVVIGCRVLCQTMANPTSPELQAKTRSSPKQK
jgi:hypothetical protein